ncbi:MAG: GNAT family N-acetyltransferase [Clostridium sp.]|nr:GNAT family N-acetyltransferase [Clostridium sp.]
MIKQGNIKEDFNGFYDLLYKSFPTIERRTYEGQKKLLNNDLYNVLYFKANEKVAAFLAYWEFEDFIFIEHFAVDENLRGRGTGTKILDDFLINSTKEVILEVELPLEDIAIRRIEFYKRIGFNFNDYEYMQPPLQKDNEYFELKIMSYPKKISREKFLKVRDEIYKVVYSII